MEVHLLALTALVDPGTPPAVLDLLAARNEAYVRSYLLAHPNAPQAVVQDPARADAMWLEDALQSPAANDDTRARVLARETQSRLSSLSISPPWSTHPTVLAELTTRAFDDTNFICEHRLLTHPHVDPSAQQEALRRAAAGTGGAALPDNFVYAATGHPTLLDSLTKTLRRQVHDPTRIAAAGLLDEHARTPDPRASFAQSIRVRWYAGLFSTEAICLAPEPALAAEILKPLAEDSVVNAAVLEQAPLLGTSAWVRAAYFRQVRRPAPTDVFLPLDPVVAIADHAHRESRALTNTSVQPLDAAPSTMAAAARSGLRSRNLPYVAAHIGRLLLHPNTPQDQLPALRRRLLQLPEWTLRHSAPHLAAMLDPTHPLEQVQVAQFVDRTTPLLLTARAQPILRSLWQDIAVLRTVFALEPTFTGTYGQLIDTARAIAH